MSIRYQVTMSFNAYDDDNEIEFTEEQEFGFSDGHYIESLDKYEALRKSMCKRMADESVYQFACVRLVDRETWETIKTSSIYL